jgi:hypothetical protein
MTTSRKTEKGAFHVTGRRKCRNSLSAFENPLFIDASRKDRIVEEEPVWHMRSLCLRHGEGYHWKSRCAHCRYLIRFQTRRFD